MFQSAHLKALNTNFLGASWLMLSSSASSLGEMVRRSQPARASTCKDLSMFLQVAPSGPPLQYFWSWRPWQQFGNCASCSSWRSSAHSTHRGPPLPHRSSSALPDEANVMSTSMFLYLVPIHYPTDKGGDESNLCLSTSNCLDQNWSSLNCYNAII